MLIGTTALVLVLALFIAFAGWAGLVVGRAMREGTDPREAAGNVLLIAIGFGVCALLIVELVVPELERILEGSIRR